MPVARRLDPNDDLALDEAWRVAYERGVDARIERVAGAEVATIVAVADEIEADLIVIRRGRRRPKLRNVGRAVVHRAGRPVLRAQPRQAAYGPRRCGFRSSGVGEAATSTRGNSVMLVPVQLEIPEVDPRPVRHPVLPPVVSLERHYGERSRVPRERNAAGYRNPTGDGIAAV
jgi:hypothetical protein